jgi:type II secretory pathway pseudopilin PulG
MRDLTKRGAGPKQGTTLIEAMFSVLIVSIVGIGVITGIVLCRQLAEYDKQRLAAISAARSFLEERTRRDLYPTLAAISDVTLDNFNTPDQADDLNASAALAIYAVNPDGTRGAALSAPPADGKRVEVEVTITWNRTGRRSSVQVSESLSTYVAPDLWGVPPV